MATELLVLLGLDPRLVELFDSGDPFCTSHTVTKGEEGELQVSDCQFSITAWPKWELLR